MRGEVVLLECEIYDSNKYIWGRSSHLDNEMYKKSKTVYGYICDGFFSVGKDGF